MSTRVYAKAYLAATSTVPVFDRLGWLMAFDDRVVVRTLRRVIAAHGADALAHRFDMPTQVARFLGVLVDDRVLEKLPQIATQALALATSEGIGTPARITAAVSLDDGERRAAVAALAVPGVVADFRVDSRLGGGLKVTVGGRTVDYSLAARLSAFRRALTAA